MAALQLSKTVDMTLAPIVNSIMVKITIATETKPLYRNDLFKALLNRLSTRISHGEHRDKTILIIYFCLYISNKYG